MRDPGNEIVWQFVSWRFHVLKTSIFALEAGSSGKYLFQGHQIFEGHVAVPADSSLTEPLSVLFVPVLKFSDILVEWKAPPMKISP